MKLAEEILALIEDSDALVGFQKIVKDRTMGNVDGIQVDLTTANFVLQVYNALSPDNQAKFKQLSAKKMIDTTMELIKRTSK
jgi:hypothetical protein